MSKRIFFPTSLSFISLLMCSSLLFNSCKNKKELVKDVKKESTEITEVEPTESKSVAVNMLINKRWKLFEVMGEVITSSDETESPTIYLSTDKQLKGFGGCNSIFGIYTMKGKNFISFSELSMTERACNFKHYDEKLMEALGTAQQFILTAENQLQLIIGKRAPLAKFQLEVSDN